MKELIRTEFDFCFLQKREDDYILKVKIYYDHSNMCYNVRWEAKFGELEAETMPIYFNDTDKDSFEDVLDHIKTQSDKKFKKVKDHIKKRL